MGLEPVFLVFWLVQVLIFLGLAIASTFRDWRLSLALILGCLIGFAPWLLVRGPAVWMPNDVLLAAALLAMGASFAIARRWIAVGGVLVLGASILIGSFAQHGDPASVRVLGLIQGFAIIAIPLLCALAARALVALFAPVRNPVGG